MLKSIDAKILIIDDEKINRILIKEILLSYDIESIDIDNGKSIINILEKNKVDLILLDVIMPGIDGYAVCKKVKNDNRFKDIPVLFLSSNKDDESIEKGFEAGGQDFITKPFNMKELVLRIKTNIELKKSKEKIYKINNDLKDFMYIASHDLQSPLVSMSGFANVFIETFKNRLTEEELFPIFRIEANSRKMQDLIKSLLDVSRLNTVKNDFVRVDYNDLLDNIIETLDVNLIEKGVSIHRNQLPVILGDKVRLETLLRNLISNSIKYGAKNIDIGFNDEKKSFYLKDDGVGIEPDQLENIFKPGSRLQVVKIEGVGMGLSFCKKVVDLHNGRIWAESEGEKKGTTIFINFPEYFK